MSVEAGGKTQTTKPPAPLGRPAGIIQCQASATAASSTAQRQERLAKPEDTNSGRRDNCDMESLLRSIDVPALPKKHLNEEYASDLTHNVRPHVMSIML